jgi:hypothetical protein
MNKTLLHCSNLNVILTRHLVEVSKSSKKLQNANQFAIIQSLANNLIKILQVTSERLIVEICSNAKDFYIKEFSKFK